MINWKVRAKNVYFWMAIIPAVLLLIQTVMNVFGVVLNVSDIEAKLLDVVNAVFGILAILGIVNDPTTASLKDSAQAMLYRAPKE